MFRKVKVVKWTAQRDDIYVSNRKVRTANRAQMASYPTPHDRTRSEDEDDPVDQMISKTGCAKLHYEVQECMAEHQDWRKCQLQVQNFKDCMMAFQNARKEQLKKQFASETL
ncbi:hypothetical protein AGOR_G00027190 [Albula goreensis]|uniref:Cytochrome c oxidase assembly factor 4 homolog, mitochondrial n=1 Tax=Albula goreensis TaxID=1534307 RepID=A0A8T3E705_9TELE|nr:hypothetical protein AGOR_G00027190 [Albula goreensis]